MVDRNDLRGIIKRAYNPNKSNIDEVVSIYKYEKRIIHLTGRIDELIIDITEKEIKELFG